MEEPENVTADAQPEHKTSKKRRAEDPELEIDINLPEPPSKKALRKAKKAKVEQENPSKPTTTPQKIGEDDLKRLNGTDATERSKHGIWIGNLAFTTTKKDLYKFLLTNPTFQLQPEQITRIHMPPGHDRRAENKGFAYVDLISQEFVDGAVKISETLLGGRRLLIKDSNSFEGRPEVKKKVKSDLVHPPSRKIFVGNLDFDTDKATLDKHFGVCGPILKSQLATFEDSGKCKGYAWVEFESLFAAEAAMRGWVEVPARRKGEDGEGGTKRVWLHRMGERKLRLEFAEDSTTRYNKRFGKNADAPKKDDTVENVENGNSKQTSGAIQSRSLEQSSRTRGRKERQDSSKRKTEYRYDKETVQKLTGAIVEGQGNKVLFD
jgi:RNA recognition motif-containing protein